MKLLNREEAAEYLRIKPQTLAKWAVTNKYKIRYHKVGSRVVYDVADLEDFVKNGGRAE